MGTVQIALLLCLVSMLQQDASAIECYSCIHLEFSPNPPPDVPNIYKNPHCRDHSRKSKVYAGDHCPNDGKDYVCGKVNGTYTFDVPTAGITNVQTVLRRCLVRPAGFNTERICMKGDGLDKASNDISLVGAAEDFGDMTQFDGEVCYCNENNCNSASVIGHHAMIMTLIVGTLPSLIRCLIN